MEFSYLDPKETISGEISGRGIDLQTFDKTYRFIKENQGNPLLGELVEILDKGVGLFETGEDSVPVQGSIEFLKSYGVIDSDLVLNFSMAKAFDLMRRSEDDLNSPQNQLARINRLHEQNLRRGGIFGRNRQ